MEKLQAIVKRSFGSQIPIRERFFNIIFSAAVLIGIAGVVACIMLGSSEQAIMVSAGMTLTFPLLAFIGIKAKRQTGVIYFSLIIVNFVIFPALYLSGGAINCGIPSYFAFGLALTLFLTTGIPGTILAVIESLWYAFIFFASWRWPSICTDVPAFSRENGVKDFMFQAITSNTLMVCIAAGIVAKIIFHLYQREAKIVNETIVEVERQSIIDPLTAVYNRRHMYSYLTEQVKKAKEENTELSVVLFDIDHFKDLNDTYGHLVGDAALKALASIIKRACKDDEIVARYGGEEFLLILPGSNHKIAMGRAEEIRICLEKSQLAPELPADKPVTISGGVCTFHGIEDEELLVAKADERLYKAKQAGRNQIVGEEVDVI
ncbi:MAG: GGDEF domain-containing protein [Clostridia bacterium]|nr:GGDEF domain-containing protein [Clostridia bacterium]